MLRAHQKRRIQQRARQFTERWTSKQELTESKHSEDFMDEFFSIFGIDYHGYNIFPEYELPSKCRIDVFWPSVILIENKSPGSRLSTAFEQARNYYQELDDYLKPKYILVNDFHHFEIYSFKQGKKEKISSWVREREFSLGELSNNQNISLFHYFFSHKYEKIKKAKRKTKVVRKIRPNILKLVLASSLSLALGYIVSDGQPRAFLERLIQESGTIQDRPKAGPRLPPATNRVP